MHNFIFMGGLEKMNKKIICCLICTLFISAVFPVNGTINYHHKNPNLLSLDWIEYQKLNASDGEEEDYFGEPISIYEDYAVIGAYWDSNSNGLHTGSAYVFRNSGSSWDEVSKLIASDVQDYNHFGISASIYGDYIIIGADMNNNENGEYAGCVYIFKCDGSSWYQEAKLIASDGDYLHQFGFAVSIYENYVLIGSPNYDHGKGGAYIFERNGSVWEEQAILKASDNATIDFGMSVSLYSEFAVVGASDENDKGLVYIFKKDGLNWTEQKKLVSSNSTANDFFGSSISVHGDIILIGSFRLDEPGSTYVFKRDGADWIEVEELKAPDNPEYDSFGITVSFDGNHALIGTVASSDLNSSVYIFKFDGTSWDYVSKLTPSDGEIDDYFGGCVSIYDNYAFVGAPADDDNGEDSGSVYIFKRGENQPPNPPIIHGPSICKVRTACPYNFTSEDPDGDDVSYYVRWSYGDITNWTDFQASGPPGYTVSHSWDVKGVYIISAKAKDNYGLESDWSDEFEVTVPRDRAANLWYKWFLERFPVFERLLSLIRMG